MSILCPHPCDAPEPLALSLSKGLLAVHSLVVRARRIRRTFSCGAHRRQSYCWMRRSYQHLCGKTWREMSKDGSDPQPTASKKTGVTDTQPQGRVPSMAEKFSETSQSLQ